MADSRGGRNGLGEALRWCHPAECLSRAFVELLSNRVQLALVSGIIPSPTVLGRSRHDWVMTHNEAVLEGRSSGRATERRGGRSARTERNAAPFVRGSHVFGLRSESACDARNGKHRRGRPKGGSI